MSESAEIKLVLKKKGLNYRLKDHNIEDNGEETFTFVDVLKGMQISGKVVNTFNEGEIYHWPLLNHENIAPLIDVLYIRDDFNIFLSLGRDMTLKDIVHDEDFVYDPQCFERKRSYARGIFSGLSYLHGKSFCLMNLSDTNIVISKLYDKAIITDFSSLVCAKKSNKCKMKVLDVYRAPETEKDEFDPVAAEIWASGTLMLEMFLAHMVPWAIIDYKPKKIMEIVEKLSLELLQAANTGSIVSSLDLTKFKTFLKCFFKQNPAARISARYASIASFLRPKILGADIQAGIIKETMHAQDGKETQIEGPKSVIDSVPEAGRLLSKRTNTWNLEKGTDCDEIPSLFFYKSSDSLAGKEACKLQKAYKSCQTTLTWPNKDDESENFCYQSKSLSFIKMKSGDSHDARNNLMSLNRTYSFPYVKASSRKKVSEFNMQNGDLGRLFGDKDSSDELSGSQDIVPPKKCLSKDTKAENVLEERKHNCVSCVEFCKLPISNAFLKYREGPKSDLQEIVKKINLLKECQKSLQNHLKVFISDEFANRQLQVLKEYERLLHQKNVELLSELKKLCDWNLRQENFRLLTDQEKRWRLDSNPRRAVEQNGNILLSPKKGSFISEVFKNKFLETESVRETVKDLSNEEKTLSNEKISDIIMPNIRLNKNYSYCRAIEHSEKMWDFDEQEPDMYVGKGQKNESTEKLIESALQMNGKAAVKVSVRNKNRTPKPKNKTEKTRQKSARSSKKDSRHLSRTKEKRRKEMNDEKDKKEKNNKKEQNQEKVKNDKKQQDVIKDVSNKQAKEFKKPFFFSFCPGGKIENSELNLENLCEACKLSQYHAM